MISTTPTKITSKRKPAKVTGSAKVTLAALGVLGFIGSWNLIARQQNKETLTNKSATQSQITNLHAVIPTPWPTVASLAVIPPVPTLEPIQINLPASLDQAGQALPTQIVPLPTLAPLPTLGPLPAMPALLPPTPPIPSSGSGGGQRSGGS